jgi:hypothetical protein
MDSLEKEKTSDGGMDMLLEVLEVKRRYLFDYCC